MHQGEVLSLAVKLSLKESLGVLICLSFILLLNKICDPVSILHVTLKLHPRKGLGWRFLSCGPQHSGELTVPAVC